jgi:hypothetical protein
MGRVDQGAVTTARKILSNGLAGAEGSPFTLTTPARVLQWRRKLLSGQECRINWPESGPRSGAGDSRPGRISTRWDERQPVPSDPRCRWLPDEG